MSIRAGLLLALLLGLTGCDAGAPVNEGARGKPAAQPPVAVIPRYRVAETFNVGDNVFVRALAFNARNGHLIVGTSVGALEVDTRSGEVVQTYTRDNALANEYVFAAMVDSEGGLWLGTTGGGVSHKDARGWTTYFPFHGLADYWVYAFTEQADGRIWIGTWAGVSVLDRHTGAFRNYVKELVNEWVYGLAVDSRQRVWLGTEGGVNMFDGERWHVWTQADGLGAPNTDKLPFSSNTGLGTRARHDLSVLAAGRETYNPNYVFSMLVTTDDQVWAGTWGGGASRFDGQRWHNLTTADGLAGNIVYSLAEDADGGLWFGTNHGVSHFRQGHWQHFGKSEGLLDQHVYAIAVDDRGDVWVGTRHGVARLTATTEKREQ